MGIFLGIEVIGAAPSIKQLHAILPVTGTATRIASSPNRMASRALSTSWLDTDRLEDRARPALGLEDNPWYLLAQPPPAHPRRPAAPHVHRPGVGG